MFYTANIVVHVCGRKCWCGAMIGQEFWKWLLKGSVNNVLWYLLWFTAPCAESTVHILYATMGNPVDYSLVVRARFSACHQRRVFHCHGFPHHTTEDALIAPIWEQSAEVNQSFWSIGYTTRKCSILLYYNGGCAAGVLSQLCFSRGCK